MRHALALILIGFSVASCAAPKRPSQPAPPAAPPPKVVVPPPAPAPAIIQPTGPWTDWPMAAGSWAYRRDERGSIALYGVAGTDALVTLRCDSGRRTLFLSRAGTAAKEITIRTSSTLKTLPAMPVIERPPYVAAAIIPTDPILDAMAYSRGRIAIEAGGLQSIAIPVWSEIGRVVEDCRA